MSNRSLRARSGPARAFLILFFIVCALSTWNAHADGSYVAALPDDELKLEVDLCHVKSVGNITYTMLNSHCLVTSFKKRWMNLYNRAIDTLNKDVNLGCDETHAIFDNTSERVMKEFEALSSGEKPLLRGNDKPVLSHYAETEVLARLTNGRGSRDKSCSQGGPGSQNPSLNLTGNTSGSGANPTNARPNPPITTNAVARPPVRGPSNANTQDFTGPRVANANLGSCSNQDKPACDNSLMRCLRGCNSSGNVDQCNAGCQQELLSCKGCK